MYFDALQLALDYFWFKLEAIVDGGLCLMSHKKESMLGLYGLRFAPATHQKLQVFSQTLQITNWFPGCNHVYLKKVTVKTRHC